MTPFQIKLVQESFAKVTPISDEAAAIFYQKLFELNPQLRTLFRGDMVAQGRKLMGMIAAAVRGLDNVEKLLPAVQALGTRHAGYGVKEKDYATVAEALLFTLGQGMGPAFTPEVKAAWAEVYGVLANTMITASRSAPGCASELGHEKRGVIFMKLANTKVSVRLALSFGVVLLGMAIAVAVTAVKLDATRDAAVSVMKYFDILEAQQAVGDAARENMATVG